MTITKVKDVYKRQVNLCFALLRLGKLCCVFLHSNSSFLVTGFQNAFQEPFFILSNSFCPMLNSEQHIGVKRIVANIVHGAFTSALPIITAMIVTIRCFVLTILTVGK